MSDLVERFTAIVGPQGLVSDAAAVQALATDWRKRYAGAPLAVLKPATVEEVSAILRLATETRTAIVPQGGNTGLCGGATPDTSGQQVIVNLSRMRRVSNVDAIGNTISVEAGCTLAEVQRAAEEVDRLFPLSLASEGSCEIGGNLSTNAGGVHVLRYGTMRDLVLGLQVVLPSGEIWDGLRGLRKDNTGYDLKQLFIGAEGTLGIITAAVLKLFPKPKTKAIALAAFDTPQEALALLAHVQSTCGDRLTAFELMSAPCLALVRKHFAQIPPPFERSYSQYALIELSDCAQGDLDEMLQDALGDALDGGLIRDAVLADSLRQASDLWALRENISEAQAAEGKNIKHDISLPVASIADFIRDTDAELKRAYPHVRMVVFGHLGDGNLHYNVSAPEGVANGDFLREQPIINRIVHDAVHRFGGSISAEHGLGQYKREEILRYKSAVEMELMRTLKRSLDPLGIMNPGKVL
jgi:FAD/FMN-containing dehydrogenase